MKERKKKDACPSGRIYKLLGELRVLCRIDLLHSCKYFFLKMYACCDLFFLDSGRKLAKKLRDLARSGPAEPGPLRQLPDETVDEEFGNVTMSIDFWESGGGGR